VPCRAEAQPAKATVVGLKPDSSLDYRPVPYHRQSPATAQEECREIGVLYPHSHRAIRQPLSHAESAFIVADVPASGRA
jgi:hypothetical protein